ncbi:hypothetical protein [Sulfitobacter sp. DSM 110093]|uniref:hypothetical protein n=1 Tax=Sulfitobacter sp. DSM 110093 TaxID=2883127 RepID=UPI001FADE187|nr:hypothetical protein [Sulfitobacter sp. DSM 110093]
MTPPSSIGKNTLRLRSLGAGSGVGVGLDVLALVLVLLDVLAVDLVAGSLDFVAAVEAREGEESVAGLSFEGADVDAAFASPLGKVGSGFVSLAGDGSEAALSSLVDAIGAALVAVALSSGFGGTLAAAGFGLSLPVVGLAGLLSVFATSGFAASGFGASVVTSLGVLASLSLVFGASALTSGVALSATDGV